MKTKFFLVILISLIAMSSFADKRKIPFKNSEGKDCNDLHIQFDTKDVGVHFSPCFSTITNDGKGKLTLEGGRVKRDSTCTIEFSRPGEKKPLARSYSWTVDGDIVGKEKRFQIQKLSWHGGSATGNGMIKFSIGQTTSFFHTIPGNSSEQTLSAFKYFINSNFNTDSLEKIHVFTDSTGKLIITGNIAGDTSENLSTEIIVQDLSQPAFLEEIVPARLQIQLLLEGRYNNADNLMEPEFVIVNLRRPFFPFEVLETVTSWADTTGIIDTFIWDISDGIPFYIEVSHRNSVSTWSSISQIVFVDKACYYDFTYSQITAYGNNLKLKGNRWCIFSGDVTQDGVIDGTDVGMVDNDAFNFAVGNLVTDLTGDGSVDATDYAIADNNASAFIGVIRP